MQPSAERIFKIVMRARADNHRRTRTALLIALLVAALLWKTTWPSLQLGLIVLLAGQFATAFVLIRHNSTFRRALTSFDLKWFDSEAAFLTRSHNFAAGARMLGFVTLAYGFWVATRNVTIAVLLGLLYPLAAYFGIERNTNQRMIRNLRNEKRELESPLIN